MSNRTIFLIDGFNVYHSACDIEFHTGQKVKWLDYYSLCKSYLSVVGGGATLEAVYYFSAYAYHIKDPDVVKRHEEYIKCLEETGVEKQLGRFKPRKTRCSRCHRDFLRHEEKETDVAIASKMFELLAKDKCDCVVIVTGDTDLAPAVKTAKELYAEKKIVFAFPHGRKQDELLDLAPGSFKINYKAYMKHQLPDPFPLSDGTTIAKPSSW